MPTTSGLSPDFLSALSKAYATLQPRPLSAEFLADLQQTYDSLNRLPDLTDLAQRFDVWRDWAKKRVAELLRHLPEDDPLRCPVSWFRTMEYGRLETAHTRTLAWLLNGAREHGFGDRLLVALLSYLFPDRRLDRISAESVEAEFAIDRRATDERGRFDVFARGNWWVDGVGPRPWALVIEAKIDAGEGHEQLQKYEEWLKLNARDSEPIRVFLTRGGHSAETGSEHWFQLDYRTLVGIFRSVYPQLRGTPGFHFLQYYLAGVLQDVCGWRPLTSDTNADPHDLVSYLTFAQQSLHSGAHNGNPR